MRERLLRALPLKPRTFYDLRDRYSLLGRLLKHSAHQGLGLGQLVIDRTAQIGLSVADGMKDLFLTLPCEGNRTREQKMQKDPQRPDVAHVVIVLGDDFGSDIGSLSASGSTVPTTL
jgi:hypothetical protein